MKIVLLFKTPDISDQLTDDDREDERITSVLEKFIKNDEYVRIEFDTETKTCRVLEL